MRSLRAALAGVPGLVLAGSLKSGRFDLDEAEGNAVDEWTGLPIPIGLNRTKMGPAMNHARRNRGMYRGKQGFNREQSALTSAMIATALG